MEILSQLKGHFWDVFSVEALDGKLSPLWTHPGTEPSTYQAFHQ